MGGAKLSDLNEMLNRIQILSLSNDQTSVYDQIRCKAENSEKFVPPTTHEVAAIEDLADLPNQTLEK